MQLIPAILLTLMLTALTETGMAQVARIELRWQNCPAGVLCQRVDGYGTAVAVAHHHNGTVFATAAHSFRAEGPGFKLTRLMVQGKPAELKGQWLDTKSIDFALVFVPGVKFPLVPVAVRPPQVGDSFHVSGFDFAVTDKPVIRYYKGKVTKAEHGDFGQTSISWPVGTSGGPVVNEAGELIGIAVHSSGFMINWDFARVITAHFPGATLAEPDKQSSNITPLPSGAVTAPNPIQAPHEPARPSHKSGNPAERSRRLDSRLREDNAVRVDDTSPGNNTTPGNNTPGNNAARYNRAHSNRAPAGNRNNHQPQTAAEPDAVATDARPGKKPSDRQMSNRHLPGTEASHGRAQDAASESRTSPEASTTRHAAESVGTVAEPNSRAGGVLDAADTVLLNPWVQALIVGASGGTGAAVLAGWQMLSTIRRRRREGQERDEQHSMPVVPMPSALTPPTSSILNRIPQTAPPLEWVNADSSFYARAHDEARRQIGKRYPGAQEVLEAELSLVRQFLAGQQPASSSNI